MFFIKFVDLTDEMELVVFPRTLQEFFLRLFVPRNQCIAPSKLASSPAQQRAKKTLITEEAKKKSI